MKTLNKNNFTQRTEQNVGRMVESIVGCKWSLSVLHLLRTGINRPGELQRQIEG